jgi:hypothetical protein
MMDDNNSDYGECNSYRINLDRDYELHEWVRSLRVTEEELRAAVRTVGDSVASVRKHLSRKK